MSTRLHIVVPDELIERLDQARGIASRSAWIRQVIQTAADEQAHPRTSRPTKAHADEPTPTHAHTPRHTTQHDDALARQAKLNQRKYSQ